MLTSQKPGKLAAVKINTFTVIAIKFRQTDQMTDRKTS